MTSHGAAFSHRLLHSPLQVGSYHQVFDRETSHVMDAPLAGHLGLHLDSPMEAVDAGDGEGNHGFDAKIFMMKRLLEDSKVCGITKDLGFSLY